MSLSLLLPLVFGVVIGISLGAIGGGGSILTVPILVYVMGQGAHAATATSLAVVGATALVGAIPHWQAGRVSLATALPFGAAGIGGAFVGAWANHALPGWLILALFGTLMLVVGGRMFLSARLPLAVRGGEAVTLSLADAGPWARVGLTGLGVGLMTGFFGVGGGFLIVPALVLVLGLGMREAVGTSLVVIAINSAAGLLAHLRYDHLAVGLSLLFVVGGAAGALLGARLAGRIDERRLQRGFALFVVVLGLWLIATNLHGLAVG
ncbi:MAG TPA: sulfite exporter TauE/SafE family protein [Thermomicrobiaceae bacterium]|nr:sulfite exporter TauE/SafE family protein [Thermomicrobiaceae bacterium]